MKVHEAINLYNLHANPENLKGHQQVNQKLQQMVNWGFIAYENDSIEVEQYNTTLVEMFHNLNAGQPVDPENFVLEEYDTYDLDQKLYYVQVALFGRDPVDDEDRRYFEAKWKKYEKKFQQVIAKVRPQTVIDASTDYDGQGIIIVGAPIDYVRFCLGFASQQPE